MGPFLSSVCFPIDLPDADVTFHRFIADLAMLATADLAHQAATFEAVQQALFPDISHEHEMLMDVLGFVGVDREEPAFPGLVSASIKTHRSSVSLETMMHVWYSPAGVTGMIESPAHMHNDEALQSLTTVFTELLVLASTNTQRNLAELVATAHSRARTDRSQQGEVI